MKKLLLLVFVISSVNCSSNNNKPREIEIFDKLFEKKEQTNIPKEPVQNSENLMDSDTFWKIIASSKSNSSGDYEKQQTELEKELLKLTAIEILEFDNRFRTLRGEVYNWDFWAAAYIINGGCSDDCYSDFRGWLIGQGKSTFENAVKDINTLTQLEDTNDGDWEGLSYVPTDAYEKKTGNDMPQGIRENMEITGVEWNEEGDDLKNKYPELWKAFVIN